LAAINSQCREINVRVNFNNAGFTVGHSGSAARVPDPTEMIGPLVYPFYLGIVKAAHEADCNTLGRMPMDAVDYFNGYVHAPRFHPEISRRYRGCIISLRSSQ
jgi:hypothetical protein